MFLQISLTYARNSRRPNTLPCGTPEVSYSYFLSQLPVYPLCERPGEIPLPIQRPWNSLRLPLSS
jgi:hypothetical protein